MKYVIIGGVAGGATAAARIRRNTEKAEIILFEKGEYISYANCGLPYYIGGVISDRERLFVQTPEAFARRFRVDVRTASEVTAIDVSRKEVTVRTSAGREYVEAYDKLLLSPGASPVRPPLPGIDSRGIFTLRNVQDTDRIKDYVRQHQVRRALVVGGGFIGLEILSHHRPHTPTRPMSADSHSHGFLSSLPVPNLQRRLTRSQHVPQWKESPNPSLS